MQPVVFCGLFPIDAADYERLRDGLAKLRLPEDFRVSTIRTYVPDLRPQSALIAALKMGGG